MQQNEEFKTNDSNKSEVLMSAKETDNEILDLQHQLSSLQDLYQEAKEMLRVEKNKAVISSLPEISDHEKDGPSHRLQSFEDTDLDIGHNNHQDSLLNKVKQMTNTYTEEQQKLDLCMKIQQTRQRQLLQRKLLAKKAAAMPPPAAISLAEEKDARGENSPAKDFSSGGEENKKSQRNMKVMMSRGMDLSNLMRK